MQLKSLLGHFLPLCLFVLSSLTVSSQSARMTLFKRDPDQEKKWNSLRSNQQISVLQYNESVYEQLRTDDVTNLQIDLPTPDQNFKLNLVKNDIFADGFFVSTDKEKSISYTGGIHYKGQIEGQPGSIVAISFFDNEVIAVINETNGGKYVVGQSSALRRGSFAVYKSSDIEGPAISCLSESLPGYSDYVSKIKMPTALEQRAAGGCVNIYFELGQSVFSNKGGAAGATNYITGAFNVVSALYANDGVTAKMSQVFVWTTPEPYAADASNALTTFGQAKLNNFNGHLAQLVRLKTGGSMSGIAWVNVLCYGNVGSSGAGPFSYSEITPDVQSLPTFSWTAEVITHELGHNLGSPHTQSCSWTGGPIDNCVAQEGSCAPGPTPVGGGTIMSYCHLTSIGINFTKGFGPQPKALILSRISAASCVVACATSSCITPTGLVSGSITTTGATVSWTPVSGAVNYTVDYKPSSSSTWASVNSTGTVSSVVISGLASGIVYNWQVKTNCAAGSSASAQAQFTTGGTTSNCTTNPPGGLVTSAITTTSATMTWSSSVGSSSYSFYSKAATDATWTLLLANTTSLSTNVTGLSPGITYQWRVNANCTAGSSGFSQAQFTTLTSANCTSTPPSGLTTTSITLSSATLSWGAVSTATTYAVQYKLRTSGTWITLIANIASTSITLPGLTAGLLYDWQVRSNCSAGSSAFAGSSFTTTAATCAAPVTLTTTNIASSTCTVNWSPVSGVFNYTLEIKLASAAIWTPVTVTTATSTNITGLIAGSVYQWHVKTNCTSGLSGFTQAQFTTTGTPPAPCNTPTSLTSSTITFNSGNIAWAAVPGAVTYVVEYKVSSSPTWNVANGALVANSGILMGLNSSTSYDWRLKTNCSSSTSAYTATAQFTTLAPPSAACPGTLDITENGTTTTAKAAPFGTDILGQINPSGDIDYFSFVVSTGGTMNVSLTNLVVDYDLRVENVSGTTMAMSQNSGTTSEAVLVSLTPGIYYIRVYGWNGASSSSCYTLKLQPNTASIEYKGIYYNPDALSTTVFPNPATSILNYRILGLSGPAELTITDIQGRKIMTSYTKESLSQLNVSSLAAGFYFLKVRDENNKTNIVKFMKTL